MRNSLFKADIISLFTILSLLLFSSQNVYADSVNCTNTNTIKYTRFMYFNKTEMKSNMIRGLFQKYADNNDYVYAYTANKSAKSTFWSEEVSLQKRNLETYIAINYSEIHDEAAVRVGEICGNDDHVVDIEIVKLVDFLRGIDVSTRMVDHIADFP